MKQMLSYRTVLLAQTGICSGILPMALEYTTSVTGFINKLIDDVIPTVNVHTVHTPTRSNGLQATSTLS
jgi:hypothetical protein